MANLFQFRLASVLLFLSGAAVSASAHPIHASVAEADFNHATRKLGVALRVFADDFAAALSARSSRTISVESTPAAEFDALARAYIGDTFVVKGRDRTPVPPTWIRRELKADSNELWLFFELDLPAGVEGALVRHGVLADQFRDQLNSVHIRDGERKATLIFLPTHREKVVRFPP